VAGSSRLPQSGTAPWARRAAAARARSSAPARASAAARVAARAGRRRRSRRSAAWGGAGGRWAGAWAWAWALAGTGCRAQSAAASSQARQRRAAPSVGGRRAAPHITHELQDHPRTLRRAFEVAARRGHPAGRHPPGHRPALRLPRRRLRLVQEPPRRRPRDPRRAPAQGAVAAEEAEGFILTCCATPQTDCVVEARSVPGAGEYPVLKLPSRVMSIERPAPDVAVLKLQLPANQNLQYRAGQYVEFILRDGARRSYSMANAPHALGSPPAIELHVRHMPGGKFTDHVFSALKERDILRMEGPFGSFFLREESTSPSCCWPAARALRPSRPSCSTCSRGASHAPAVLYWGAPAGRPVPARLVPAGRRRDAASALRAGAVGATAEDAWDGRTGFVHQAVMADWARSLGPPGVRLRRTGDGGRRPGATSCSAAACRPTSSTPTASRRRPTRPAPPPAEPG
jgi:NAD(P)H-flavin reductase